MWMFGLADPDRDMQPNAQEGTGEDSLLEAIDDQDQESVADEVNVVIMNMLPWVASALFHVGLVVLTLFIIWSTVAANDEEEVLIPLANLSKTPGVKVQMQVTQRVATSSPSRRVVSRVKTSQSTLNTSVNLQSQLIGVRGGSQAKASPFGKAIGTGNQFSTGFVGVYGGNAKKVVFLIDASGSLIGDFRHVIIELKKTILKLSDKQVFAVVFYQNDDVIEIPPAGLKKATAEHKRRAIAWIDQNANTLISPRGLTNPRKAIRLVLKYKPQVLFILSDNITGRGRYELDQEVLLAEIARANTGSTRISTIQYLSADPLASIPGKKGTLEMIADRTGGNYKFVDGRELGIE